MYKVAVIALLVLIYLSVKDTEYRITMLEKQSRGKVLLEFAPVNSTKLPGNM